MYKVLGLFSPEENSGKYIPAHFTEKRQIELLKGEFGPECTLYIPKDP